MVKKRLEGLGIEHIYLGKDHKLPDIKTIGFFINVLILFSIFYPH